MIERAELHDAAQKAFPADQLKPAREASWPLIAEMGWLLLPLPEDAGGLGLGRDASAAIHYELGRVLSTAPLLPALLAVQALGASETLADKAGWIERACGGELITASLLPGGVSAHSDGALAGRLAAVPDADMAGHVLVLAPGLAALVALDAPGVSVSERKLWDESRRLFDVSLDGARIDPALVLAKGEAADALAGRLQGDLLLALAADALGGATAALDMSIEYLKTRKQFGRPLAMFQALKHRAADLKAQVIAAEALLWSRALDDAATTIDLGALKALACDVYRMVVEEAIQFHGGIGLTEEHPCHLFMKRAMLNLQLGGGTDHWREQAGRQALAGFSGN